MKNLLDMRIHTEQKAYYCKKYGKAFRHSSGLAEHQRIYMEENLRKVMKVGRLFPKVQPLNNIRKFITKTEPPIVVSVVIHIKLIPSEHQRGDIQ